MVAAVAVIIVVPLVMLPPGAGGVPPVIPILGASAAVNFFVFSLLEGSLKIVSDSLCLFVLLGADAVTTTDAHLRPPFDTSLFFASFRTEEASTWEDSWDTSSPFLLVASCLAM